MKVRVTLLTENNKPVSTLGENPERKIRYAYNTLLGIWGATGKNGDKGKVEKVEILEGE